MPRFLLASSSWTRFVLCDGRFDRGARFESGDAATSAVLAGFTFVVDDILEVEPP